MWETPIYSNNTNRQHCVNLLLQPIITTPVPLIPQLSFPLPTTSVMSVSDWVLLDGVLGVYMCGNFTWMVFVLVLKKIGPYPTKTLASNKAVYSELAC